MASSEESTENEPLDMARFFVLFFHSSGLCRRTRGSPRERWHWSNAPHILRRDVPFYIHSESAAVDTGYVGTVF